MTRTRSFLSALLVSTALLAELAAPKARREHQPSIHALPIQNFLAELQAENKLPSYAVKPRREVNQLVLDALLPPRFIITKSFSCPIRHLFVPYIHLQLDELPALHPTYSLSKQSAFAQWMPVYKPYLYHDSNPRHSAPIAFLEKSLVHSTYQPIPDIITLSTSCARVQDFVIDASIAFMPTNHTVKKPAATFNFRFSSIALQANRASVFDWEDDQLKSLALKPDIENTKPKLAKSAISHLPIVVRLPKSPITSTDCPIYFPILAFAPSSIYIPTCHLEPTRHPTFITSAPYKAPSQDQPVIFSSPHMQPEKTKPFALRHDYCHVSVASVPSTVSEYEIDEPVAQSSCQSMLYKFKTPRLPLAQINKSKRCSIDIYFTKPFAAAARDASLNFNPIPTIQATTIAHVIISKTRPLVLDAIPLTIMLPTLEKSGFTFKDVPLHLSTTTLDPHHFPAYRHSEVNLQALVNMPELPLSHLVKSTRPLFKEALSRPRSIKTDDLEWINQDVHLPSLILGATPSAIPTFVVTSAPDARHFYRVATQTHAAPKSHLTFQSQLISSIELPAEPVMTHSQPKRTHFIPTIQASEKIDIASYLNACFQIGSVTSTALPEHLIDRLDFSDALITVPDPILHPASRHSLSAQLQAVLIADAAYEQQLAKKRLTPDQYIRKYGHYPTHELNQLAISDVTLLLPLHLDPLPDSTPFLWNDPELVEDISARLHFAERKHQRRSDRLNRKHRVIATNLARIPTLFDLDTTSQSRDFATTVAWLPKTTDGKYLFTITLKPLETFERIEQNVYFVIDNSNSISKGRASAYKSAIVRALPYIHKDDRFNIFIIDDDLHAMSAANVCVNATTKALAREYLENQKFFHPYKTSNVYTQLTKLSKMLENVDGLHTVYLFTDGASLLDLNKYLSDVHTLITTNKNTFNIYPTCVGGDNHISFIQMLATLQRGKVMHSPTMAPFPRKFAGFVKKHQHPIARDLHAIALSTDENAHVKLFTESPHMPAFYADQPLTLYGETDTLSDFNLMIQARFGESFVNINKKITFDQNTQISSATRQESARFQAATHFLEFLQTKDGEPLAKTNALLLRYGGHKLL